MDGADDGDHQDAFADVVADHGIGGGLAPVLVVADRRGPAPYGSSVTRRIPASKRVHSVVSMAGRAWSAGGAYWKR
ncbi:MULTISPECIES: hypothetical protein [unclassified Streptomyces]|uniref:hypothetical protein n=1 Tax=unclassified Streptomyces TaxID=2593676 RepID=UPI00081EAE24|nr:MULTISPECIES: hypothetical protein [unclassified Streptomyces]MYZ41271.1 hypothetical protein [Streptomyces sp. SID4917]SCG09653.1 hypothetical protein GA0115259_117361 [Streptomyces sp. MnatMP-M17]